MRGCVEAILSAAGQDATPEQVARLTADQIRSALTAAKVQRPPGVGLEMLRQCATAKARAQIRGAAVAAVRAVMAGEIAKLERTDPQAAQAVERSLTGGRVRRAPSVKPLAVREQ